MEALQLIESLIILIPVGLIGLWRYSAWLFKRRLSSQWEDIHTDEPLNNTRLGVAVTVKGEPVNTFREVLLSQVEEGIDQVCITFDENERECMEMTDAFAREYADVIDIRWQATDANGKREGLMEAIAMVDDMDIIMCIDSDTVLGDGVKRAVLETFQEPEIGGVTVRQRVKEPSLLPHFLFDIRLKLRYLQDIPGQALGGYVSCLSGRCSAYRADALQEVAPGLPHEHWAGIHKSGGGDDKFLTTAIHDLGYKTAAITDVAVYTRPEDDVETYMNQSLRWARNSWFSDFRALFTRGWMWDNWVLPFYTTDRIVSTFTMLIAMWFMTVLLVTGSWIGAGVLFVWWLFTRSIKIEPYLRETGKFYLIFPYLIMTLVIAILKVHALVTLWESGWLTRGANSGRDLLESALNTGYRFMTAGIVVLVGVFVFALSGVFPSDIPVVAEAGNFYRPGEDGLQVADYLIVEERPTTIVIPDNPDRQALQTASQAAQRLSEEFVGAEQLLQVKWASQVTENDLETSNLVFAGQPPETSDYLRSIHHRYEDPELGEYLADAQPFAAPGAPPIRVLRPEDSSNGQMLLIPDPSDPVHYRLKGDTQPSERALTTIDRSLGDAFAVDAGKRTNTLATWDVRATRRTENGGLSRIYGITLPLNTQLNADTSLEVNLPDNLPLEDGNLIIRVNNNRIREIRQLPENTSISLPVKIINQALQDKPFDERLLSLEVILQPENTPDDTNVQRIWQAVEQHIYVNLVSEADNTSLASYPYPYAQNTTDTPVTMILPQPLQTDDIAHMMSLSAQLAFYHPEDITIQVVIPQMVTDEMLSTSHVMILGELERQPYAQAIDRGLQQMHNISLYNRTPNRTTGLLHTLQSPWNDEHRVLIASGNIAAGYHQAARALTDRLPLLTRPASAALVPGSDNIENLLPVETGVSLNQVSLTNIPGSDSIVLPDDSQQQVGDPVSTRVPPETTATPQPQTANQ